MTNLRFRMKVRRFHAQGERPLAEYLVELRADPLLRHVIETKLDRYLAVPDEALDAVGGRDIPPAPIHEVQP